MGLILRDSCGCRRGWTVLALPFDEWALACPACGWVFAEMVVE